MLLRNCIEHLSFLAGHELRVYESSHLDQRPQEPEKKSQLEKNRSISLPGILAKKESPSKSRRGVTLRPMERHTSHAAHALIGMELLRRVDAVSLMTQRPEVSKSCGVSEHGGSEDNQRKKKEKIFILLKGRRRALWRR